jgi:small subunit ribosomal protein S6
MNNYEHTIIVKQDTSEKQQKDLLNKYESLISKYSGKILKTEKWGFLNFSNPIKKYRKGFYYHFKFEGNGETIKELENAERIDSLLLRFLTVKVKKIDLETIYFENKENYKN